MHSFVDFAFARMTDLGDLVILLVVVDHALKTNEEIEATHSIDKMIM